MAETVLSMHADYSSDGGLVTGYLSRPIGAGPWPAMVLVHEWWGLDQHSRDLSRRLAREGFVTLVPDYYEGRLTDDWREAARLKVTLDTTAAARKIGDAVPFLQSLPYVNGRVGVLGFCLGGGVALLAMARSTGFGCGVVYYQSLFPDEAETARISAPLLCQFGAADPFVPITEVRKFETVLQGAGVPYAFEFYEGAGHAFFNDNLRADQEEANAAPGQYSRAQNRAAAEASWAKTVAFLRQHLQPPVAGG